MVRDVLRAMTAAGVVLALVALASGVWIAGREIGLWDAKEPGRGASEREAELWTFARDHAALYRTLREDGVVVGGLEITLLSMDALERRMMGGFLAGTPLAGLIEIERRMAARAFSGPREAIGFIDLTDRIEAEGLFERINPASFAPWRVGTRGGGGVFGLPHDVHPVMLAYRADLCARFGVDIERIETWDDFEREMRKVMVDVDGDGEIDHYPIAFGPTHRDQLELLLLQAGGGLSDGSGEPALASGANVRALARLAGWVAGPDRIAVDVAWDTAGGQRQLIEGRAVCAFMPDWMCRVWKRDIPQLAGKMRLMPLPAWEAGGRRTSVWGGTMLGIVRGVGNERALWARARELYLSRESALALYRESDIITPILEHWDEPIFDTPDAYFGDQAKGRAYIELAGEIPPRRPSVHDGFALDLMRDALARLTRESGGMDRQARLARARTLLSEAEIKLRARLGRRASWAASHDGTGANGGAGTR